MDSKKNSKWLQLNREEMEQSIQHLLKLVEEDGKQLLDKHETELHSGNEELVAHVREFHHLCSSLADKFYVCNRVTLSEFDEMQKGSESGFEQVTPMQHKNGMDGVDKKKVQRIVYEMSKGSKYFENEQRKEAFIKKKIEHMQAQRAKLTAVDLSHYQKIF